MSSCSPSYLSLALVLLRIIPLKRPETPHLRPQLGLPALPYISKSHRATPSPWRAPHTARTVNFMEKGWHTELLARPSSRSVWHPLMLTLRQYRSQTGTLTAGEYYRVCSGAHAGRYGTEWWFRVGKPILPGFLPPFATSTRAKRGRTAWQTHQA